MIRMQNIGWSVALKKLARIFVAKNTFNCSKIIVTSYLFPSAKFSLERLRNLSQLIGKDKLVIDIRYKCLKEHHSIAIL